PKARRAAPTVWRSIARIESSSRPSPAFRCSTPRASISARSKWRGSRPTWALPDRLSACSTSPRAKVFIAWTPWRKAPTASAKELAPGQVIAAARPAPITATKMVSMASSRASIGLVAATLLFGFAAPLHAKEFLKAERPQTRGYSQAVITEGGKIVWLAGQLAVVDDSRKSLAGDLDGQVRQIFKLINATLEKAGGKLRARVKMTVFIPDVRSGDRLTQIRREIFGDNFPGSALITVTALAIPEAKVEIQGYAVIGSK